LIFSEMLNGSSKKIKFLLTKVVNSQEELNDSREIYNQAAKEIDNLFKENYPSEEISNFEKPGNSLEFQENDVEKPSPKLKSIFKKIALKAHPDRLLSLPSEEVEKREKLFTSAAAALEDCDILKLMEIAQELDIPVPDLSQEEIISIEKKINDIKEEIGRIQSTVIWKWYFSVDPKEKDEILKKMFELMYERNSRT